jgi:hypothetical protein
MKKLTSAALAVTMLLIAAAAFAQEQTLKLSGEAKTGVYWQQVQQRGKEPDIDPANTLKLHSKDDAGSQEGRFRVNMDYDNGGNFGFRGRIDWENWSNTDSEQPKWRYAFGYGNFFENQLTVSLGKLGGSPWGTGGPEMWKELEQMNNGGGMRVEFKPAFIPEEYGRVNVGFVLNWLNSYNEMQSKTPTLADLLSESVVGVSYTHDKFMARFAYRFDSEMDWRDRSNAFLYGAEGGDMVYRLEEYMLRELLPGMSVWALGHLEGIFADDPMFYWFRNWMFAEYSPPELFELDTPFTAQIRLGYDYIDNRSEFSVKPSFYWHFSIGEYQKLISAGASFSYRQDFGKGKVWEGSPYHDIEIEPKIQLNFSSSYIAFVYNWREEYMGARWPEIMPDGEPTKRTQYINLRFCVYY